MALDRIKNDTVFFVFVVLASSFSQSNNSSVSSEMQQESNNIMPLQEKNDRETRHVGSIISDNVRNSQSVKTVK